MFTRGMRRALALTLVLVPALALVVPAASGTPKPAEVKLVRCSVSAQQAIFRGRMLQVADGVGMRMRFTLLKRTGTAGFRVVRAPGLGVWRRSRPGVKDFAYRQAVQNLPPGAVYRMRVDFRWYDRDGALLLSLQRNSARCRQFAALPNLSVRIVKAAPTQIAGVLRYRVRVSNLGRVAATNVPVGLQVDGDLVDTVTVASLLAGEGRELGFRGPECTRSVRAEVDGAEAIVESSEQDNVEELRCADLPRR